MRTMRTRRLGRLGHDSTVLIYGAAALSAVDQDTADRSVAEALAAGINHFDVAANYGDAELRLGPWMAEIRGRIFLATKTEQRAEEDAWREINRSLERLRTDHVDLIQLHAVGDLQQLDLVTGPRGALAAAIRARDEGLVGAVGITGHGHQAPATHLEALRRFPFDTVLTPWNVAVADRPDYARDFTALSAEVARQDAGLMTIKTLSRRNWPGDGKRYATWYEPLDDQEQITAAVAWVLSFPQVTGLPTAGDVRLLAPLVQAERDADRYDRAAAEGVLRAVADYSSPFLAMPF